ncbi:auxilin-related protein 2-like isoform X1 [Carya illinoinensis]|uniref:J domain-containing protein n=1 Tax=Carya illinoinensis TaxID=32201 RepID=A0A8T1QS34_CARIL|nr:auxilin-related protein 2-like isoform X1 [Carya illinoinensis]KAG6657276.1 hypothetical protein CIPAW_04G078900 [Carya illinoinensis]KAG6657277.1 hypothetical protein CIPAW_04G078900 [Carya illinoinensis]
MNDFENLIPTDLGFKPQGKAAPMSASKSSSSSSNLRSSRTRPSSNSFDDRDYLFTSTGPQHRPHDFGSEFGDLFGSARFSTKSESTATTTSLNFGAPKSSARPVYDKPVYDDDIFDGVPGLKTSSSRAKYEDVFASVSASSPKGRDALDDLLAGFGKLERESKGSGVRGSEKEVKGMPAGFDDLIPGFGGTSAPSERPTSQASRSSEPSVSAARSSSNVTGNPFNVSESTSHPAVSSPEHMANPLEEFSRFSNARSMKSEGLSATNGGVFDDMDPFNGLGKAVPAFSLERKSRVKDKSPVRTDMSTSWNRTSTSKDPIVKTSARSSESHSQKKLPVESDQESHQNLFEMPTFSMDAHNSFGQTASPHSYGNSSYNEANAQVDTSPRSEEKLESSDDVWLTVSEIPLFTQPTSAPPPSRPPPPRPVQVTNSKGRSGSPAYTNSRKKMNEYNSFPNSAQYYQGPKSAPTETRESVASPFNDLEDFPMDRSQDNVEEHANGLSEELGMNSAAAAMKEAMDRAEAKFRHAREVRGRESTKSARTRDAVQLEKDERTVQDERALREKQERLDRERLQWEREEEEKEQKRLEKERERAREIEREREEKEKEQRRLEKERERAREIEREREKARQAVERATREARERAAAEARLRAEKTAVEKATAEARERAERAAVQRAQTEARERAAAGAKERAEKAAAEARDRAAVARAEAEARLRAERAAVERAAAEARERAAAAARMNQQKNENDLESFFSMGSQASVAARPRANSSDPVFDSQSQNRQEPEVTRKSASTSSNIRKVNPTTNFDDLSSIFGAAAPSSGEFQEVEGESEDRRRARLERHQRTQERAAKALAEKNQRDLQTQRDQAERHRIAETLDVEIKRWAAGKEGNLRALLSTLQFVLWPECGWQPVSLTDMITAPAVKKVYRKATLSIHPDKVQQKGATLQQKYVAEKVFDLLKEAWNKFNSEELF